MVQTSYNDQNVDNPQVKGGLVDAGFTNKVSRVSAAVISFGVGLSIGADGKVLIPAATGSQFEGVAMMKHKAQSNALGLARYDIGEAISTLRKGRIWVFAEEAVDPTDAVFLRHTVNGGLIPGDFRTDADTANADQITNAKWVSVLTAAGLAILEINMP